MEKWRHAWRTGFAPTLQTGGLEGLGKAMEADDYRLVQGQTVVDRVQPGGFIHVAERACPICYANLAATGEYQELPSGLAQRLFHESCDKADEALGRVGMCGDFLAWVDRHDRAHVFKELLPEVKRELQRRAA